MYNTILSLVHSLSVCMGLIIMCLVLHEHSCSLSFRDIVPFPEYIYFSGLSLPQQTGILSSLERELPLVY